MAMSKRTAFILIMMVFVMAGCVPAPASTTTDFSGEVSGPFVDLHDPALPDVLIKEESGYQLDPAWEVESIGFVYQWWGLSPEPVFEYLQVERDGSAFRRGDETVDEKSVQALVDAIANLHR